MSVAKKQKLADTTKIYVKTQWLGSYKGMAGGAALKAKYAITNARL